MKVEHDTRQSCEGFEVLVISPTVESAGRMDTVRPEGRSGARSKDKEQERADYYEGMKAWCDIEVGTARIVRR